MILREELQKLVKGEVRDDDKTLKDYSRDYSIFELRPRAVVFPKDAQDVKKLVAFAARERAQPSARGGHELVGDVVGEAFEVPAQV